MRVIHNLELYQDMMGHSVTTPVVQVGSGTPHVVMVALQHGWELIGLDTGLQVMQQCNPIGTLTLISVASPSAFQDSARLTAAQIDPQSRQTTNLNRVHPGNPNGTLAERSAWAIDQYIQSLQPDAVIDLHAYAGQSVPHAIVDSCEPSLQQQIQDWMRASNIAWYREYEGDTFAEQSLDGALSALWVRRGIPSVTIEHGPLRSFSPEQSQHAQQTLCNVLTAFGAIRGKILPATPAILAGRTWQRHEIVYDGNASGYLRPIVSTYDRVKSGDVVAQIIIPSGDVAGTVHAPVDGMHFIWHDEYRIAPGSLVGIMLACHETDQHHTAKNI